MKNAIKCIIVFLGLFSGLFFAAPLYAQQSPTAPNEVIVKYKNSISENDRDSIRKKIRVTLRNRIDKLRVEVVKTTDRTVDETIKQLKQDTQVEYAEPNFKAEAFGITNDTALSQEWGLFKIDAANTSTQSAWDITTGSSTVKIAILDTGIEESHSDLAGKVIADSNFTTSSSVLDQNGHGTHVAGIAAAATNNGSGIAGTGYNTSLLSGKVLDDTGSGSYSWVINGITWAADQGAKVISMSLGGSADSQALQDAVNYAWSKGVVVVVAAGNSNSTTPSYPAYYTNAIAVAATDNNDKRASFSNYGQWVDVAAPGVSIYSTYKTNSYTTLSGTSMATPFVAGEAALIWAKGVCSTNQCVRDHIEKTADQISGTGTLWTYGRINAYRAVSDVISTPTSTPTSQPTPTPTTVLTPTPTPTPVQVLKMTVSSISMSSSAQRNGFKQVTTIVTVVNEATLQALSSANVSISIKLPSGKTATGSGKTGSNSKITFTLTTKEKGTFTSTVTNVVKTGYTYHPTLTTKSLTIQ